MGSYVIRRLLHMVLVLLGTSVILFASLFLLPGNPVDRVAGSERVLDKDTRTALEAKLGLDQPLPVQYGRYLSRLMQGDLGESYRQGRPVNDILGEKVLATAELALVAIAFEILIGLAAGVIAAVFRYSFWDFLVTLTTTLAIGVPTFVGGLLLQDVFALRLRWLPLFGRRGAGSVILPALTLASVDAALVARLTRGTMLEALRADYVRTAVAKGLSRRVVMLKHVLRNSVIPVVTYLGIAFGTLLGGALVTEAVFNWDGIGLALVTAISTGDNPVIIAVVTYGVAAMVLVNLLIDIAYAWLDPRIRLE